jgi:hypothetical protein
MLVAYASGGQKYLDAIYYFFTQLRNGHKTIEDAMVSDSVDPYGAIREQVPRDACFERAEVCAGRFGGDLDRLRDYMAAEGIPH